MEELSVIIPSFHSKELTSICIKSFEKFKPQDLNIDYIVVENSDDISYKDAVTQLANNVTWISNMTKSIGSYANAEGIIIGLRQVTSKYVFLCHCDTCVTSELFFDELSNKIQDGYRMVGMGLDNTRIKACHISGILVDADIARTVGMYPSEDGLMDVGDDLTKYCRDNSISHCCFDNTFNSFNEGDLFEDKYKAFQVDRSVNGGGIVIFMHLGRGIPKTQGVYQKEGRVYLEQWLSFCNNLL